MALLTFKNIGISGISACVPRKKIINSQLTELMSEEKLGKAIEKIGIKERRIADPGITSSDLCYFAARKLLDEMEIDRVSIDMLIFISSTPDYRMPATSAILQDRLNLPKTTAAFDVNLACSGFVYGAAMAFGFLQNQLEMNRILLLVGDTPSKYVSLKDKATALLFGDGGTATIIEKKNGIRDSFFSLNTDGKGEDILKIKAGGFRYPSNFDTLSEKTFKDGSLRNDEQLYMKGSDFFHFTINEVLKDMNKVLTFSGMNLQEIDYIIFHQSNKFMVEHLVEKAKIPLERVPFCLQKYGNTTSFSIPLTIVSELEKEIIKKGKIKTVLSGFGAGISWGTAIMEISDCYIPDILEV